MKHEPKPNIEYHYHIEELINNQQKRVDDREFHRERAKAREDRNDIIKDAQGMVLTDFFCVTCRLDFKSQAVKQVEVDWSNPAQNIAFYKTKCFKGHWCMRLVTDRHIDQFWYKSINIARERGKYYKDTLQPFETGYNMLYGKK